MVLSSLGILGAILSIIGIALGKGLIIGAGVLLFFAGFFIVGFTLTSIPVIVWIFIIILFIWGISKKK